jgi:hypothetical protein
MKSYKVARQIAAVMALAAIFAVTPAFAQLTIGTPVTVKQTAPKNIWLKAEVVHADAQSMTVRERGNQLAVHTFTYSENLQGPMRQIHQAGGYQYGDKVKILYKQGQTVALRIKGKPSL